MKDNSDNCYIFFRLDENWKLIMLLQIMKILNETPETSGQCLCFVLKVKHTIEALGKMMTQRQTHIH